MMYKFVVSLLVLGLAAALSLPDMAVAQEAGSRQAWVFFRDKKGVDFDPYAFFDPKAIDRRLNNGLDLFDTIDFPVKQEYIDELSLLADTVGMASRWLNAVFVMVQDHQIPKISSLPFVERVEIHDPAALGVQLASYCSEMPGSLYAESDHAGTQPFDFDWLSSNTVLSSMDRELVNNQIRHMQGELFLKNGIDGNGIRVAIFDAGFPGVDTHEVFRHLHEENKIIATWDFHRNRPDVYAHNAHGTMVFSMIGGLTGSLRMGLASGAEYILARTEIRGEPFAEERYWLAAAEWADQMGADIINSSLGYFRHRYFPEQMDGRTSLVTHAARVATQKGILVVNAAGNEGINQQWRIIITPADMDSVLTVGAVQFPSLLRTDYSSVGPTADLRMKPNLMAMGDVVVAGRRGYKKTRGTSFASPLLAGFAACLWQMYPTWTNMEVMSAMQQAGSLFPYFDYAHGYGVPQAGYFFHRPVIASPTFDIHTDQSMLFVDIRQSPDSRPGEIQSGQYLFYHIRDPQGFILQYYVIKVERQRVLSINLDTFESGQQLFVFYDGYTTSWKL